MLDWFALTIRHQHERAVARQLEQQGLEVFLPLYRARRQWSDRVKSIDAPLFPGYLFCRFEWTDRLPLLSVPSVTSIVSFGGQPAPVPECEISAIQSIVDSKLPVEPVPYFKVGQRVRVAAGPLNGLEGLLVSFKNSWRVVVSVEMLQRSVGVEIDRGILVPAA